MLRLFCLTLQLELKYNSRFVRVAGKSCMMARGAQNLTLLQNVQFMQLTCVLLKVNMEMNALTLETIF